MRILLPGILLLYSSYTDIKKREISALVLMIFMIMGIVCTIYGERISLTEVFFGVFIGVFLIAISILTHGELGLGDGLLLCVTGLYLGFVRNILLLLIALFISAIFSMFLLLFKCGLKREYPFVPFLFLSYSLMFAGGM